MSHDNTMNIKPPSFFVRVFSVWFRHYRVYIQEIFSNGIPPFLEPLFALAAFGLGLGQYIVEIENVPYIKFLASAIMVQAAMFTAAFECSFGTFIRLEFDKVYDGMLSSPLSAKDILIGEILFAGTKGLFFSVCILIVISSFRLVSMPFALLAPISGFLTGLMFGSLSLLVTSFVNNINHFNFYFTGFLTPLYFFSGIFFPISSMPENIRWLAYIFPLSHVTNLSRAFCLGNISSGLIYNLIYIFIFIIVIGFFAVVRLKKRLIN